MKTTTRFRIGLAALVVSFAATACSQGNAFDMAVGECFQDPDSLEFSDVDKVDCAERHDNEVFAIFDLTTESLPSVDVMQQGCEARFDAAIGIDYYSSIYFAAMFGPTSESWNDIGDREVVCFAYLPGEKLVGSVLGSGR